MTTDLFSLEAYLYDLPPELIAKYPCEKREDSRLLVVERQTGRISEMPFKNILSLLNAGDSFVFNNTKVIPARLIGKRKNDGEAEIFLLKELAPGKWETLARPGKKLKTGDQVTFGCDFSCTILETLSDGNKIVQFVYEGEFSLLLEKKYGQMPLPHYMQREASKEFDTTRYQTVYAKHEGAVAAPTAGLHFSEAILNEAHVKKIDCHYLTLHVGIGTFKPVQTADIRLHPMHLEEFIIDEPTAEALNARKPNSRQICVGTTCCRALESAIQTNGVYQAGHYQTNIFIYPGYKFKSVQSLLTNFHLPGSTLLMLVSAFAGHDLIRKAYQYAIEKKFRFFSYGDAMLIL